MYIGGMSSSLPEDVQDEMYHSVPGLEHAKIVKNAYAIEYDCINPRRCIRRWNSKRSKACSVADSLTEAPDMKKQQHRGLIAGINAAMEVKGREQLVLDRSEAYIGVLIE